MENYAPANFYQNYYIIIFEKYLTWRNGIRIFSLVRSGSKVRLQRN